MHASVTVDGETQDAPPSLWPADEGESSSVWRHQKVQELVVKFWDLFKKEEDSTILKEAYDALVLRFLRIYLPGLSQETEATLCANSWQEAAMGSDRLDLAKFFQGLVRIAQSWCDSNAADDYVGFLEDLLSRSTCFRVSDTLTGEVNMEQPLLRVAFRPVERGDDMMSGGTCGFCESMDLVCSGAADAAEVEVKFDQGQLGINFHTAYFEESAAAVPSFDGAVQRVWSPLDSVRPMGFAITKVFDAVRGIAPFKLNCGDKKGELAHIVVEMLQETNTTPQALFEVTSEGQVSCDGGDLKIHQLVGPIVNQGIMSGSFVLKPERTSILYKLSELRKSLLLDQSDSRLAAASLGTAKAPVELPTFPDLLAGRLAENPATKRVQPVKKESLLASGSLSALADTFLVSKILKPLPLPAAADEPRPAATAEAIYEALAEFPKDPDGLCNDDADIISLARTPPLVFWVFGECDVSGEYKTEVCRRLAQKLRLQWLQPTYVLELAVRTPPGQRSALAKRCVEQLQRGMTVQIGDALRLTLETMSSALCKANGYILDFPPVGPEEVQEVSDFFEKVKSLSSMPEVTLEDVLKDEVLLEPLAPEPEPPKPPEEEAEGEAVDPDAAPEGEGAEGAEGAEEEGRGNEEAPAETPPEDIEGAGDEAAAPEGEGEAAAEEAQEPPPPPPPPPPVPNPWSNTLPRWLVVLSMESDEVGAWRLQTLKLKHEEKARLRKELEDAGEEVPEEEEEEPEEPLQMPEEEEEQQALFDKMAGDALRTMEPFYQPPPLEAATTSVSVAQRLPALPDESQQEESETVDREALKTGEAACVQALRKQCPLPLLSLRADGRPPTEASELLEVMTGPSPGLRVPLPAQIEGAGEEAKELLRLNLEDAQQSRRWSPWRLHCPVSLHEKRLIPGSNEFAVDFAGYVFLCAGEEQMRRFCQWPKRFLTEAPRINAPGLALGFGLLSPCGFRAAELAKRTQGSYGFDIVDVVALLERAMKQPPMPEPPFPSGEDEAELPPMPAPGEPYLMAAERADVLQGKSLALGTCLRLIGWALGIEKNISLIQEQAKALEEAKKVLEEAQAAGNDPPEDLTLDDEGQPVVRLSEPLQKPSKGFILQGFPESVEQFEALEKQLGLALEQVLVLKPGGEEPPEVSEILTREGYSSKVPLQPILESQLANFEALAGAEGLRLAEVAMEVTEEEQFVQIRKHIDPFYEVAEDAAMAAEIPDPDEWAPEEVDPEVEAEPQEPPVIPWGSCGSYCPVTLKQQRWLYPGQKDFQHVYRNYVFALGSEAASEAFLKEPVRYVPVSEEPVLPPPRVMVTGPTGSGVAKQCEMLGQVYKIPVLKLEELWRAKTKERLDKVLEAKRAAAKKEALQQPMVEDGNVNFPEGWVPPEEKPPGDEDEEAVEDSPAEEEPEDDGLDDEQREELFVQAMKDAFGPHCGACIVDGSWFGDLEQEEMSDEVKAARSLQNLLTKAQRIPDLTIILKCKNDFAAKNSFDFDAIDRDYEERLAVYKAEVAAAEAKEEDPPEPPEGLVVDEESEEKESDRVKAKFIETKKSQQDALQEFAEALKAARAPLQKVSSDRGDAPTHKAIRWHCRPFVEKRQSLLLRQQVTKVSPSKAKDLLERGLVRVSKFGASSPLLEDSPSIRPPGADLHPAVLRNRMFYPASADELSKFLESPADYLTESGPSRAVAVPAIAVLGAPLSGKTTLARALSKRTGAVCISVASVLGELIAPAALPCKLSKDISKSLRSGKEVPTDLVIAALKQRLVSADCLRSGWILDDFPCTVAQAEALTHAGIVPHRVLMLSATEEVIFSRTLALNAAAGEDGGALLQQELALQKERLSSFHSSAPALRVFYALIFENLRDIDGARSSWAVFDQALKETAKGELKAPKGRPGKNQQRARIPRKLPAEAAPDRPPAQLFSALVKGKDGRGLQPSDMVSYMQASLAEVICQGLVDAGEKRPLYPGKSPGESVLVYLARFLRARNPLGTELYAESASQSREDFLSTCSLPSELKEMTEKKKSPDYAWTSTDTAKFEELCARFDEVFPPKS